MKKIINILNRIINKLNNMSDRDKMILGYTVIVLGLIATINVWLKITIWCIKYAVGLFN